MAFSKHRLWILVGAIPAFFFGKAALEEDQARDLALMELEPPRPELVPLPPPKRVVARAPEPSTGTLVSPREALDHAVRELSAAPSSVGMDEEDRLFVQVMAARQTLLAEVLSLEAEAEELTGERATEARLEASRARQDLAMSMVELPFPSYLSAGQIDYYSEALLEKAHGELDRAEENLDHLDGEEARQERERVDALREGLDAHLSRGL